MLHLWSLGIEEQFYIVWPLLLWLAWKRRFNLLALTVLLLLTSFLLNIRGVGLDETATFYSPQTRFWELLCGALLAWFGLHHNIMLSTTALRVDGLLGRLLYRRQVENNGQTLNNGLSFLGLSLLGYGFWRINAEVSFPGGWAAVPVAGAVLVILAGPGA